MVAKRKSGARTKSGRLKKRLTPWDYGNQVVQARNALFAGCQGGKAGPHLESLIGRVWAVGLLENGRIDPAELRDAGHRYAAAYWANYGITSGVANYGRECRRGVGIGADNSDPRGEAFIRMDAMLDAAGREARKAVIELAVDPMALTEAAWIVGLVNLELVRQGRAVTGFVSSPAGELEGRARLADAVRGLLALCEGRAMRRAA